MITKSFENKEILPEIEGLVRDGLEVVFVPKGSSMSPFIKGGVDRVLITKAESIAEGDIVLALTEQGSHVLHRVEKVDGNMLILMGDGNLIQVEEVVANDIKGILNIIYHPDGSSQNCLDESWLRYGKYWYRLRKFRRILIALLRIFKH